MSFKSYFTFLFLIPFFAIASESNKSQEYEYLDQLGIVAGTDKSSIHHNYTKHYAKYFATLKDKPIRFLEIGIYKGDSVKMWENYFPNAELHFIDITDKNIKYFSDRSTYHYIDQSNIKALKAFAKKVGEFDIIIDDGGHRMNQQKNSFYALFPFVKQGGMYIVEDLHTSYWSGFGGFGGLDNPKSGPGTMVDLLQNLIHDVNYVGASTSCADCNKLRENDRTKMNIYRQQIDSLHFYDSLCFIIKK